MKKSLLFLALFTFSLTGLFSQSITITSPNGSEQWAPASSHAITWNSSGGITDVNIYYSTNNGTSFSLVTPFLPNSGTYSWTIPAVNSTQCRVRIVDANNTNIADTSDAAFTIAVPASLTLTHPNGGDTLTSGTSDTITWTSTGTIDYLELYYSTDFGSSWIFLNDGIQNTGSYIWTVPDVNSSECMVKIMEIGGSYASDSSNTVFTIQMPPPSNYALDFDGVNDYVNIPHNSVFNFNGGDFTFEFWNYQSTVINGEIISKRTYSTADGILIGVYNGNYVIWLSSGAGWNVFNGYAFATATGEIWNHIAVVRDGGNYKFYKNGVLQNTMAGADLANNSQPLSFGRDLAGVGAYAGKLDEVRIWNVARNASEIQSYMNSCVNTPQAGLVAGYDFEDGTGSLILSDNSGYVNKGSLNNMDFLNDWVASGYSCVAPSASITITYPNGGETLISGALDTITWTSTGTINYLEIYYSTDSGSSWIFVNDGIQNYGYYIWTVPAVNSSECIVKIMEIGGSNASDSSNSVFSISSPSAALTITYPNGGEVLTVGTTVNITWTTSGTVSTVDLYYSTDEGIFWNFINESLPNTGSYSWTIPNDTSSSCRVKIMDSANPLTVFDSSDTTFTIQTAVSQIISTIAGTGTAGYNGDGTIGTSAQLNGPIGIGIDASANIYVAEFSSNRIRKINAATGIITTVAGTGTSGYSGDGGISTSAQIGFPMAVHVDASGNIYIADMNNSRIRKINGLTGIINTIAGNGTAGYSGDGGPATSAKIWGPNGMCTDASGNVYFVDGANARIRIITTTGLIATVAGTGTAGYSGDGGAATSAQINPTGISIDASGNLYIADRDNHRIRKINSSNGIITTIAGNGSPGFTGDGGLASAAKLNAPGAVYFDASGNLYIADKDNQMIRKIDASGIINTVAGNGTQGYAGDGGPATSAELNVPTGVCADASGNFYIADYVNHRIRKVGAGSPPSSSITITYPNGGETLTAGTTADITWTSTGTIGALELYYSTNGGSTWNFADDGITASTGSYSWTVPSVSSANCLISLNDAGGGTGITDTSNAVFTIQPAAASVTLTSPNGGEQWVAGSSQNITWTSSGITSNVILKYSTNYGQTWTLIAGAAMNTGTYSWTVPTVPQCSTLVKISDYSDTSIVDVSNSAFCINPASSSLTITSPDGGETLTAGTTDTITWISSGTINYLEFYYSTDGGSTWNFIDDGIQNTGSYVWSVPAVSSANCLVLINEIGGSGATDTSDAVFTISTPIDNYALQFNTSSKYVSVTDAPAFNIGNDFTIEAWVKTPGFGQQGIITQGLNSSTGYAFFAVGGTLYFQYYSGGSYNNGSTSLGIAAGLNDNNWHHIAVVVNGANGKLYADGVMLQQITTMNSVDESASNIHFGYHPNVGQFPGQMDEVRLWSVARTPAEIQNNMNVCFSGPQNGLVAAYNFNDGPNSQVLTDYSGNGNNGTLTNMNIASDWVSSGVTCSQLSSSLTITSPDGGENWSIGTPYNITWNTTGTVNTVDLYYSTNGGNTWNFINDFVTNTGSYSWTIPNAPSTNCKIKIEDTNNPSTVFDISNAAFAISTGTVVTGPEYIITTPNGGEAWYAQSYHYIYWTYDSVSNYVNLEYSINDGNTWNTIISGTYNYGYYYWLVPNTPSANCKVRISDYYDTTTTDISDTIFTILPAPATISVSTPNNGESWAANSNQYIYWNSQYVDSVKIEYTINNGSSWNLVTPSVSASIGYYYWNIPNTPSDFCKVRISQVNNPSVFDISDNVFKIILTNIMVATPDGGEVWTGNTYHDIYWNSSGITYIKIDYSLDNGTSWSNIVNGNSNNGYYNWYVPNTPSTQCLIKVSDYYSNSITDSSNSTFTISVAPPSITLTTPNGGEQWIAGSSQYIYWSAVNSTNVKVEYSINNGFTWNTIVASTPASNGYYYWNTIPSTPSAQCLVKVSDASQTQYYDVSNYSFSILAPFITVSDPNGGETYVAGSNRTIYWTYGGTGSYVTLEYSTNGGAMWNTIVAGASNNGSYNWNVPNTPSTTCKVRISDYYDSTITDISDNNFSIAASGTGTITVSTPNGGEQWTAGSSYNIWWTSQYVDSVDVYYTINNGSTYTLIASGIAASTGYYTWNPIPSTPSNQCRVKVVDADSSSIYDASNTFSIVVPSFTVTSPNGGEILNGGSYSYIYWIQQGASSYVKIDYSLNNGGTWTNITNGSSNSGSYNWYVPNTPSNQCLVKVMDYYTNSIVDSSNAVFTINPATPVLSLSTPNGGQNILTGSSYSITWTSSFVDSVKIEYSTNYGSSWNLVAASVPATNNYHNWTPVPNTPSAQCLVKISDLSDSTYYDVSNYAFSITQPYLMVTTPNGGDLWTGLTYKYIYWTGSISSNYVKIDYSVNGGSTWNLIVNGAYNSNQYQWYVPDSPSVNCLVRVSDYADTSVNDLSDAVFTINAPVPTLAVTTPNGGQVWSAGTSQYIYWSSTNITNVKLEYSINNGNSWATIVSGTPAANGYYYWPIPNVSSNLCKVRISNASDSSLSDISDNVFSIIIPDITVTTPNGGEQWTAGTNQYLYWTSSGTSNYINIWYSINAGASWTNIANGTYNYGYYNWYVPNTPSTNCLIKISDYYDTSLVDISNAVFTIGAATPTISLSTPNGGQTWYVGTSQYIYWSSSFVTDVKLEYSINNGSTWNTIIASTSASNASYYWTIPNTPSDSCLVKITDVSDTGVYDISNYNFSIVSPFVTVSVPNEGEIWNCNTYNYIYWTNAGLSNYVNLEYSTDSGDTWTSIAYGTYNYGYYNWYVPAIPSVNCLIRVTDYYTSSLTDISDYPFTINCSNQSITVTDPNGGEQWGIGNGNYIYWTSTNVGNVKIEYSINSGSTWTTVASSVPAGNASYWWTVPNTPSSQCLVKISDVIDSSITDMSNAVFSIINPSITVTQPEGGEQWTAGTSQLISWMSTGISGYITISYSINNGNSWIPVANGINNNSYYYWTVPNNPSTNCRIKVSDYYNSSLSDVNDTTFTILAAPPALALAGPDGGEVFSIGTTEYIYWTSTSINYVKLEYTYNGGTTWNVIQSSIAASNGYYAWPVPNTPTSAALVRISDASNTGLNDQSNGYFSIVSPKITVTTPNGNESWTGLTNQYIYWNSTAVSNYVTIEYSINNGLSWSIIANGTYNYGYYNWPVPNNPSVNCLVRVKDYYNNTISDISDSTFTILAAPASIVVNSPNGGETWGVGTTKNITWSSSAVNNVKIEYSVNGGASWNVIIGSTAAANGYYSWPVPNNPSGNCFVKITSVADTTISDQSNNDFTIVSPSITVTSPNGAESWTAGTGNYIYWISSGISSYVKIEYSTDSGSTWANVVSSAYNNGSYWWTVPNTPSAKCFVRISDYYNNSVNDAGNSVFSIVSPLPSITLTSPNGGETLIVGNTYYIYWNSTGVSNVKLEYSANGGSSWNTIIASAVNNGSYNWPVPNNPSTVCLIKVSDAGSPGTNDVSNNYFTISSPYITLTQPNGGEVLQGSNGYYISWASAGVSYVKIEYSINNGSSWSTLVSSSYNNGYYYWIVPNDSSSNCLVKVSSTANPSMVNDQSNNVFTITPPVPSLTLNSPNSGEYWYVGYQYYITWSSSAVSNVKLEYSVNGGTTWAVIIASTSANSGFYYWPVPNNPSVNCKVRVSDASASAVNDVSYGLFTIATPVPSITVNYPNGGENWLEGSYQYVSWTKNFVNTANVQYSIDSGATWNTLISNTSSTYYYWTIPGTASTNCLVKVVSASDTSVADKSDAVFTINLYVPNTNTIATDSIAPLPFCKEDTFSVYYTANGVFNAGNVFTAQLSDSNGNFNYPLGIGSLADTLSGTIACIVPSSVMNASGYRIRVVSSDLSTTGTDTGTDIIISSPEFDFAASEIIKYLPDGSVQFSFIGDTSGVMSYAWSFGNGDSSAVADPTYVYSTIGYYTVDLTVTDDNACDINLSKYNYMRIEQLLPNTQLTTNTTVDLTDVYFSDIATGIMTMADGNCLITIDSGTTWTVSYTGLNGYAASVSMQPGYWVVTGANGSIVYSVDNGLSWLPQYTGTLETFFGSSFSAPDFGFSVGTNGVVFNYNGISWTSQTSGISATLNSVYTLGNNAYSVGNNGSILYYNGSTWATQTTPVSANLNSVFFTGLSSGLAVGDNGYILNYDGTDWNVALSGVDVNFSSVTATGDSAWAVSNKGIIYWSDDAGLTWMRYSVGSNTDLSGISYVKSGGKAASSSKGYIGGKGGEGRMIGSEVAEDTTTGLSQTVKAKNNFLIYPNPALDMIYLETILDKAETMVVQLRDINGNLVKTVTDANITGFYSEHIDVSSLASGVYFVHVLQGDKFWVRKVVVQ